MTKFPENYPDENSFWEPSQIAKNWRERALEVLEIKRRFEKIGIDEMSMYQNRINEFKSLIDSLPLTTEQRKDMLKFTRTLDILFSIHIKGC